MDLFKRSLAPITGAAWAAISDEAVRTLKANLSARRFVDVRGPMGVEFAAVNLGRLQVPKEQPAGAVRFGLRQVLPLVETRVQFEMDIWELDNAARGAVDIDLDPVIEAAKAAAKFEEEAIYHGFGPGRIVGLAQGSAHKPLDLGSDAGRFADVAAQAVVRLREGNVTGPYAMVLGPSEYRDVEADCSGYPISRRIEKLIEGPILFSPFITGGFLLSTRGGDFELTLGQDFAVGFETGNTTKARFFVGESFTFRVITPEAVVTLRP